jgi:phospholipase C
MNTKEVLAIAAILVMSTLAFNVFNLQFASHYSLKIYDPKTDPVSASNPATPIQHLIFIIAENHAFDNLFGTFPGLPTGFSENLSTCIPYSPSQGTKEPCEKPFNADNVSKVQESDQCHTYQCAIPAYNNGEMNGFYETDGNRTMAYYDGRALPEVWDLAAYYNLNYNFFSSVLSYSESNHLYMVAAASPKEQVVDQNTPWNLTFPEIGTAMTEAGVTWGYFQNNWNDSLDCTGNYTNPYIAKYVGGEYDGYWSGEAQFRAVQDTVVECSSLGNVKDFQNALMNNTLPQVSFVIPDPSESGHPSQGTLQSNQQFIASVINMIESSQIWPTSATFVTWDDWGGYYDSVVPAQIDQFGDGFRVPLIAVSPYSIPGGLIGGCDATHTVACSPSFNYYDNYTNVHGTTNQDDFSAFLSTIEYNWGIKPIAVQDAEEPNLFYMLNFSQAPLQPLFFNPNYTQTSYPLSSCYASDGCRLGTDFPGAQPIYNAQAPTWAESNAQAAMYAGNGDPDD